jgi:putative flippase GtrA
MVRYVLVGGAATGVDWGVYYLCAIVAALHYQLSLVIAQVLAGAVHYLLNKTYTFRCTSRQIVRQIGAYVLVACAYLLLSMVVMYLLVDLLGVDKMLSRVATTGIMIVVSFFLHRAVTFNERFFAREGPEEREEAPAAFSPSTRRGIEGVSLDTCNGRGADETGGETDRPD